MAVVYKATDHRLNRAVAVKVLRPELAGDPAFVEMFGREARAAAKLSHPNVINIYDIEEGAADPPSGTPQCVDSTLAAPPFIVMEFVDAPTLKALLRSMPRHHLAADQAVEIARQVALALTAAHGQGLVHRDIKPGNIMVRPDGSVKVTDFGIAKATSADTLTNTGSIVGSVHYFSPEQAQGGAVGPASDLYALGVVLYEMLTGTVPFEADSPVAVAMKQVHDAPRPPRQRNPEIPPNLERIVLCCMEKDPARRYPTAQALLEDLDRLAPVGDVQDHTLVMTGRPKGPDSPAGPPATGFPESAGNPPPPGASPAPAPAGAAWVLWLLLIIGAAVGAYLWLGPHGAPVAVPNITGLPRDEAESLLTAKGLRLAVGEERFDKNIPFGTIIGQLPAAGQTLPSGSAVTVILSKGPPQVKVPSVTNKSLEEARTALEAMGLSVRIEEAENSAVPVGSVISQSPLPGAMVEGRSVVTLIINKGGEVTVPDLTGKTQAEAQATVQRLGLSMQVTRSESNPAVAPGTIISQDPPPGAVVKRNQPVRVVMSSTLNTLLAPDLVGKTIEEAQGICAPLGITLQVEGEIQDPDGHITDQDPSPRQPVTGHTVRVRAVRLIVVPSVAGKSRADAEALLKAAGLIVGAVTTETAQGAPAGTVLEQNPSSGIEVAPGTAVDLVVAGDAQLSPVPTSSAITP